MSAVFIVLPLALLVVFAAVIAYAWAVRRGQLDDLTTPAIRMLHEDGDAETEKKEPEPGAKGEHGPEGLPGHQ